MSEQQPTLTVEEARQVMAEHEPVGIRCRGCVPKQQTWPCLPFRAAATVVQQAEQIAAAWDEGVKTALNHAINNDDGITLRLEHLDGRPWLNPHRALDVVDEPEVPAWHDERHPEDPGGTYRGPRNSHDKVTRDA